jgi:hypothetical protein
MVGVPIQYSPPRAAVKLPGESVNRTRRRLAIGRRRVIDRERPRHSHLPSGIARAQ